MKYNDKLKLRRRAEEILLFIEQQGYDIEKYKAYLSEIKRDHEEEKARSKAYRQTERGKKLRAAAERRRIARIKKDPQKYSEYVAKRKEYERRPEVIAKRKQKRKLKMADPEVRARRNEYSREWHNKKMSDPKYKERFLKKSRERKLLIKFKAALKAKREKAASVASEIRERERIRSKERYAGNISGRKDYMKSAKRREYQREYQKRPEVRARRNELKRDYGRSEEYKAKRREYLQRPEVRARERERARKRYEKKRSEKTASPTFSGAT